MSEDHKGDNSSPAGGMRLTVLLGVLILAILALVYDYKVARPAIETAYAQVDKMTDQHNRSTLRRPVWNDDVQKILGRAPISVTTHPPYVVETYRFSSGLPFRNHEYYAVYLNGHANSAGKLVFVKQFMFELPDDELRLPLATPRLDADGPLSAEEVASILPAGAKAAPNAGGQKKRPQSE